MRDQIWKVFGIYLAYLSAICFVAFLLDIFGIFDRFVRNLSDSAYENFNVCQQLNTIRKESESTNSDFDSQKTHEFLIRNESNKSSEIITEPEHEYTGCLRFIMSCFFCHTPKERYSHSFLISLMTGNCFHGMKGIYFENGFSFGIPCVATPRLQVGQMVSELLVSLFILVISVFYFRKTSCSICAIITIC
jgi:hypothetical protein